MTRQELIMSHVNRSVERCKQGLLEPACMLKARSIWERTLEIALRVCRYFVQPKILPFACSILVQITAHRLWRAPKLTLHHLTNLFRHQA